MKATVSVIIPIYNASLRLERCVESLLSQKLRDIEFVFVDDCSTDGSMNILNNLLGKYPNYQDRVKVMRHKKNRGSAAARNTGLKSATGTYIGWVDADDWIDEMMFFELYQTAIKYSADIVWSDYYVFEGNFSVKISQNNDVTSFECIRSLISGHLMGAMWTKLIKKNLFIDNNIWFLEGQNMAEDLRVSVQLFFYSVKNAYLSKPHYYYDTTGTNTISFSKTRNPNINQDWINNVEGIICFLEDKKISRLLNFEINLLKLSAKKNLLVKGTDLISYQHWRDIFPESNKYIWRTNLPFYYKVLGWCAYNSLRHLIQIWIFIKYRMLMR